MSLGNGLVGMVLVEMERRQEKVVGREQPEYYHIYECIYVKLSKDKINQ